MRPDAASSVRENNEKAVPVGDGFSFIANDFG
jgi:hypothetical protein